MKLSAMTESVMALSRWLEGGGYMLYMCIAL